ncbi:MAG: glycine--tRNA ligase subunit beta [Chloroflexi bacterium]|nr:glycine--tRNA ligase subunit beta [Chloroflexota bacterium]MCC6894697.1 glycine--tRNA ligase subunit beta [Anaerolineae bacterium]
MAKPLNFQQVILKLHNFWADQGCLIWNPYNVQVGAGTGNPATLLRVLGPEPWRTAYVEPSVRPDDGRYGENPNRMQYYFQYQVILKPDPGNPQELYLQSLEALGISQREHDIRFVEDNWESPALGAWGLGWEVWLDGQEITQFTYFQQAGGIELEPVSVEITYGLERIVLALQDKNAAWDIDWLPGLTYGDVFLQSEIEHCKYYFEIADVEALKEVYDNYESENKRALEAGAILPAYDYVLKCSHLFNVLDTRGAIGVTERAYFFHRMRNMTRNVAKAFALQRETLGYPFLKTSKGWDAPALQIASALPASTEAKPADFLLEIGVEELPADDVDAAQEQLEDLASGLFERLRLNLPQGVMVYSTPRRLVLAAWQVPARQPDEQRVERGPAANRAFDADGKPTKAAEGFARGKGVRVEDLKVEDIDGGQYVTAHVKSVGRPAVEVLAEELPKLIASIKFAKTMRWNSTRIAFSRPIRWITALFGDAVIPFEYAGIASGNTTHGIRPYGSPAFAVSGIQNYLDTLKNQGVILNHEQRRETVIEQINKIAAGVKGTIPENASLLDEVTNLIEAPTALLGTFEEKYLELPREVLVMVMAKKQRYFPIEDKNGKLLPYFVTVRNGDGEHIDKVAHGNEQVLKARFSDASFFFSQDNKKKLADFLPRLSTLTFQEKLGSMRDKNERIVQLVAPLGKLIGAKGANIETAQHAAHLAKADLATQMVVEMTDLQGTMGREYARLSGQSEEVATAIYEHWMPRSASGELPASEAGTIVALADRLDSLVGLFAVGLAPKSTSDPYALRRAALGIIQILVAKELDVDLKAAIDLVAKIQPVKVTDANKAEMLEFITGRLRAWVEEQDWPRDVITAVLAEQSANPYRALKGIEQLSAWVKRGNWEQLLDGFARCVRITRGETGRYGINTDLLAEGEEKHLYSVYSDAWSRLQPEENVDAFLSAFEPMLPAITDFFNKVMVNVEDEAVRKNRLGLLQAVSAMQRGRADLSHLSGF